MDSVTISPKYQVVIPKRIREALGLRPGQKVQAIQYGNRVELVPIVPVSQMRGFLRGIDTEVEREDDRPWNVVDSSGWLEYFAEGPNAGFFAGAIEATDELIVPTVSVYEVFKSVRRQRGESDALFAVALMQQGSIADLTIHLALESARLSAECALPMADAIMLATARSSEATLWTQDADFAQIQGVEYVAKAATE